jgi:hypothetical protein
MSTLRTHVSTLAPDFPEEDIDITATLKDSALDGAPGQVPADHGLQTGVEPARSHPVELTQCSFFHRRWKKEQDPPGLSKSG